MKGLKIYTFVLALIALNSCKQEQKTEPIIEEAGEAAMEEGESQKSSPYADYDFEMVLGRFDPAEHQDYVLIDRQYADRAGMYLHKDTYQAFKQMDAAAKEDGIKLIIRSATRNFDYQKSIWERKWTGETKVDGEDISVIIADPKTRALKILEYSSMPGTSRHHWGTDIDLNSFDNSWFETGEGRKLWDWLELNASNFGFCRPYTAKGNDRPEGYFEERWHWSYMPLASHFTALARKRHNDGEIKGFFGSEVAKEISVVEKYVFGINKECL